MSNSLEAKYLALLYQESLPYSAYAKLVKHAGSLSAIEHAEEDVLDATGLKSADLQLFKQHIQTHSYSRGVEQSLNWLMQSDTNHIVCFEDPLYPPLLRQIDLPPPVLFVVGELSAIVLPQIALVGSRNASQTGKQTAYWLAKELSNNGLGICSGLAAGIDAKAHQGALSANGRTTAIMGTGIDQIYPRLNQSLAEQIRNSGALVTEFPLGTPPLPSNFPRRNRIISGMCLGVIVVEAAIKSGSLITARLAMEQNREVFAVPGSILNPLASGCHKLIREGAKLLDSVESVLEEIGNLLSHQLVSIRNEKDQGKLQLAFPTDTSDLSSEEANILRVMGCGECLVDALADDLDLDVQSLTRFLTSLEIKGFVERQAGVFKRLTTVLQETPY